MLDVIAKMLLYILLLNVFNTMFNISNGIVTTVCPGLQTQNLTLVVLL